MLSFEYKQFLNEKVLEFLPSNHIRIGNKINMRCPICGDSHKSATKKRGWWYNDTASFYCFNCSTGMSGIKFLEFISGQAYEDIKKEYTKLFLKSGISTSISSDFKALNNVSLFDIKPMIDPSWKKPLSNAAISYLNNRLVTKAPFFKNNLYSWTNKNGNEYILIDWIVNGIDAYYQLNDFQKIGSMKYIFPKDTKKLIAGLDDIDVSWPYIIVFEGFYDSVFCKNGICVGTKAITEYQLQLIQSHFPKHQIVISFDNDKSGIDAMKKLIAQKNDFKFFKWFDSNTKQKDINDFVTFKNDVNIFSNPKELEKFIVNKLTMKMYLIQHGLWKNIISKEISNDTSSSWKTRKIL